LAALALQPRFTTTNWGTNWAGNVLNETNNKPPPNITKYHIK